MNLQRELFDIFFSRDEADMLIFDCYEPNKQEGHASKNFGNKRLPLGHMTSLEKISGFKVHVGVGFTAVLSDLRYQRSIRP